jgi:sterol desaturase/sphingolipid hydroxylase (fatty acid hydroxylase superfamily)
MAALWDTLRDATVAVLAGLPLGWGGFAVVAILTYYAQHGRKGTFREAIAYVFPRELRNSVTLKSDMLGLISTAIVLPVITARIGLGAVAVLSVADFVRSRLIDFFGPIAPWSASSDILIISTQTLFLFLASDLGEYVSHRLHHQVDLLWAFHRSHHSSERLNPLSAYRFNPITQIVSPEQPVESLVFGAFGGICLYFIGPRFAPEAFGLYIARESFRLFWAAFNHCHLPINFGPLDYVMVSPRNHSIHHSAELRHRDKNFGTVFCYWDWIFGTLYIPGRDETWREGLSETELGPHNPHASIRGFLVEPCLYFVRSIRRSFTFLQSKLIDHR